MNGSTYRTRIHALLEHVPEQTVTIDGHRITRTAVGLEVWDEYERKTVQDWFLEDEAWLKRIQRFLKISTMPAVQFMLEAA